MLKQIADGGQVELRPYLESGMSPWKVPPASLLFCRYPKGVRADAYAWTGPLNRFVTLMRISCNGEQLFASGCGRSLQDALERAYLESVGMALWLASEATWRLELKVSETPSWGPGNIQKLHLASTDSTIADLLGESSEDIPAIDASVTRADIFLATGELPPALSQNLNLSIIKAASPRLQPLFFSTWENAKLNPAALEKVQVPGWSAHAIS